MKTVLQGQGGIKRFYLDGTRNRAQEFTRQKGAEAEKPIDDRTAFPLPPTSSGTSLSAHPSGKKPASPCP